MKYTEEDIHDIIKFSRSNNLNHKESLNQWKINKSLKISQNKITDLNRRHCYDAPVFLNGKRVGEVILLDIYSVNKSKLPLVPLGDRIQERVMYRSRDNKISELISEN